MPENLSLKDYPPQPGRKGYIVLNTADPEAYVILRDCPFCGKPSRVVVPGEGLWKWEHGEFVQKAFPNLTPAECEQVKSGIHDECWNANVPTGE